VTANTGLLTARCDPYGAESRVFLLGGMYPENHVGRIMWHCDRQAAARYRMTCQGGPYGIRLTNDGQLEAAYNCPGGHQGQVMPLCDPHRQMLAKRQAGLCPACAWPPQARTLTEAIERCQRDLGNAVRGRYIEAARKLNAMSEDLQAQMDELIARGVVHRCKLKLTEVS
jgi:hypothetical protein